MRRSVLVDTSSWIHLFRRRHDAVVRQRVTDLVRDQRAAWCDVVRVELWNGMSDDEEMAIMSRLEELVGTLPIDDQVWQGAVTLTRQARAEGLTVPTSDLIIVACARRHHAMIDACDRHFEALMRLK
jgi:predicted nucleic acid-binding protein